MPELPEVETVARGLQLALPGKIVRGATLTALDLYRAGSRRLNWIRGTRLERIERIGKAVLFRLRTLASESEEGTIPGSERAMVVHLGMTGRLVVRPGKGFAPEKRVAKTEAGAPAIPRHRHARIVFDDGTELWYVDPRRFGYFYLAGLDGLRDALNMGPDPFELRPRRLAQRLHARTAPIKSVLLNQGVVSGLGNIYVDEILFKCGIHPLTTSRSVSGQSARILQVTRRVLTRAIRHRGTTLRDYRTAEGDRGGFQTRLDVYGRESERCRRCNSTIMRIVVSGRGTHFCPTCQSRNR